LIRKPLIVVAQQQGALLQNLRRPSSNGGYLDITNDLGYLENDNAANHRTTAQGQLLFRQPRAFQSHPENLAHKL
jgi:hypothetical protein